MSFQVLKWIKSGSVGRASQSRMRMDSNHCEKLWHRRWVISHKRSVEDIKSDSAKIVLMMHARIAIIL